MKKLMSLAVCFFMCATMFAGVCYSAEKVIKLEFASFFPAQDPISLVLQEYSKEVEKRTNGRVTITFHPGATLLPMAQTYDSVVSGIADMGHGLFGSTPGRFPMMELLDMPTGVKTAYTNTRLIKDYVNRFKPKELQDVKVLLLFTGTPGYIHSKKPIRSLDDLKGKKIRSGVGGPMVTALQLLGAVPLMVPTVDVYDSASKGIIEGTQGAMSGLTVFKWREVLPCTVLNHRTAYSGTMFVVMNKDKWNSLPADVQQIVDKASEEYTIKAAKTWDNVDEEIVRQLKASKHTITTLSDSEDERWFQKITPVYDTYIKQKSEKGLPAAEAVKFVREWVKKNQQ